MRGRGRRGRGGGSHTLSSQNWRNSGVIITGEVATGGRGCGLVCPQRACARVTVVVLCLCMCVCVSVTALATSACHLSATNDTHGFLLGISLIFDSWIFEKTFKYANEL